MKVGSLVMCTETGSVWMVVGTFGLGMDGSKIKPLSTTSTRKAATEFQQ